MKLKKRECEINMKIVSYGGGWTDVYVNFRDGELRENESKISY